MTTVQRDGRTWSVNGDGMSSLKRRYTLILDTNNLGEDGEVAQLSVYGIPAIGASHPNYSYLKVQSYDVEEGEGSEKKLLKITTNYGKNDDQTETDISAGTVDSVEEWGWGSGVDTKEVTYNLLTSQGASESGILLNSAGDPFESVPTCEYPAPIFTKVLKTKAHKSGWLDFNCKINQNTCQIGGMSCAPKTLLASVSESRIFGDPDWKYRYTIQLRYKSNFSLFGSGTEEIEYGWDIPVVDAGMRELNQNGEAKLIMQQSEETGIPTAVTSPELLDGAGHKAERGEGGKPTPYIIRVQAYKQDTFPSQFYSEPGD